MPVTHLRCDMELMLKEIVKLVKDCENNKPLREAEKIRQERKCYEDIKGIIELFVGKEKENGV